MILATTTTIATLIFSNIHHYFSKFDNRTVKIPCLVSPMWSKMHIKVTK
jgi:hypothetical protein